MMRACAFVLAIVLAGVFAGEAAAHRGGSFGRSGVAVSAPRAIVHAPHAFVGHSAFVSRPFVRAFPRVAVIAAPVYYAPPPVYYAPPVTYYQDPYYPAPTYSAGAYYPPPVATAPQYQEMPVEPVQPQPPAYRYFCPDSRQYYPAIADCASGWLKVVPDNGTLR
jgi:hypothetical protein